MLSNLTWAALGTAFPFLMTTLGAATVFFLAKETTVRGQRALIGFAAGVMTAASIWSLLLPAIEQSAPLPGWLPASVGLLVGTLFLGGAGRGAAGGTGADRKYKWGSDRDHGD